MPPEVYLFPAVILLCCVAAGVWFFLFENKSKNGMRRLCKVLNARSMQNDVIFHNAVWKDAAGVICTDHIVCSVKGVFVLKELNLAGKIEGDDVSSVWKVTTKEKRVCTFDSPVKQNARAVAALKQILGKDTPIESIVVAVQGKTECNSAHLCTPRSLKKFFASLPDVQSEAQRAETAQRLEQFLAGQKLRRKDHTEVFWRETNLCPKCGDRMIAKGKGFCRCVCKKKSCGFELQRENRKRKNA